MKLPEDQQVLQGLLRETITLLCRNGLRYNNECSVEALIVVTLDQEKMFHTNIHQILGKNDSSDEEGDAEQPSGRSHGLSALKRRRMQSDVSEVPSKKVVIVHEEGDETEYVIGEHAEEQEAEEDGLKGGQMMHQFSRDLRNASQMSVEYPGEERPNIVLVNEGTALRTTDREEVQVIQSIGMKLPTEPDTEDSICPSLEQENVEIVQENTPVPYSQIKGCATGHLVKPRGTPITTAARITRSGQVYGKNERKDADQSLVDEHSGENGDGIIIQQIQRGEIKADPADASTRDYIRELEEEVEIPPSAASSKVMGEPEKLRKIISSAVDKVRKEVTTTTVVTHIKNATPMSATATSKEVQQMIAEKVDKLQQSPAPPQPPLMGEIGGRGRPSNLPVTTTPRGTQVAVHKPMVSMDVEDREVLRVSSQPIKVLYGLSGKKKMEQPKICNTCGQMFTSLQSLSDHECGEKNLFQCGICEALFIRKDNLKKHFEEHREEVEVSVLQSQ